MTVVGVTRHSEGVKRPKNPIEPPDAIAVLTGSFAYAQDDERKDAQDDESPFTRHSRESGNPFRPAQA